MRTILGPEFEILESFLIICMFGALFKLYDLIVYWCTPQKMPFVKNGMKFTIDKNTWRIERDHDEFWAMVQKYLEEHKAVELNDMKLVRKRAQREKEENREQGLGR